MSYRTRVYKYSDRRSALEAVSLYGHALQEVPPDLLNDREIILAAVRKNGYALGYAPEEMKDDKEIVLAAVAQDWWALQCASERLQEDKDIVLAAVTNCWRAIAPSKFKPRELGPKVCSFRDVVLEAVSQRGRLLEQASPELKADREVVATAVAQDDLALKFASEELKDDVGFLYEVIVNQGSGWRGVCFASESVRSDKELFLGLVKKHAQDEDGGGVFDLATDALKNDRKFVLKIVNICPPVLAHASDAMKSDCEVVGAAVASHGDLLWVAQGEARDSVSVASIAVLNNGWALGACSPNVIKVIGSDKKVMSAAVQHYGHALRYGDERIRGDRDVVMAAVTAYGYALEYATEEMKDDLSIVMAAVSTNGEALQFASLAMMRNPDIVLAAATQNMQALEYCDVSYLCFDKNHPVSELFGKWYGSREGWCAMDRKHK